MLNRLPRMIPPLSMLIDDIGRPTPAALGKALGVHSRTVQRWIADDKAPRPAALALFWLTRWGHSAVYSEAANTAQLYVGLAEAQRLELEQLRRRVEHLASLGDFGSANDPSLHVYPTQALRLVP